MIEYRKTKIKAITTANHRKENITNENLNENLILIGWESGASFLDQSFNEKGKKQSNPDYGRHSIENSLLQ